MATVIRPEISSGNPFHISKHRYYELKHFCLQYHEWRKELLSLDEFYISSKTPSLTPRKVDHTDEVGDLAVHRACLERNMKIVRDTADKASKELGDFIFKAVTEDLSYTTLKTKYEIPCGKELYYKVYRQFFYILDKERI